MAAKCSIMWLSNNLFNKSPTDGHLDSTIFFAIKNNMYIYLHNVQEYLQDEFLELEVLHI